MPEKEYLYFLCQIPGIGAISIFRLREFFGGFREIWNAEERFLRKANILTERRLSKLLEGRKQESAFQREYEALEGRGIRFTAYWEEAYPQRLRPYRDRPAALYLKGAFPKDGLPSIAIVGARGCTEYGKEAAGFFASSLAKENVQIIIDEATRLTTLVNDVLDLSKLQAGVVPLEREIFNLTESVRSILTRYTKLTDYHIVFYAAQDVFVNADELKISQVVYNLVNNALTYTGADKSVTLRQSVLDGKVRIAVSDTGEGIPQEKLEAALKEAEEQLHSFETDVRITDYRQGGMLYHLLDMLISQKVYLSAMLDYIRHGGGSRGSALYTCPDGKKPEAGLPELYRCRPDEGRLGGMIQEVRLLPEGCRITWRPVRPIPEPDEFFETGWKAFRERRGMESGLS